METKEIKQKIQDQFIEITEDKFTRVKRIKCKQDIIWKGKVLENKFMNNDNYKAWNCAVGASDQMVKFLSEDMSSRIINKNPAGFKKLIDLEMCRIDSKIPNVKATIIKMDLEGYELEALEGCKKLDLTNAVFAITTYHKLEHLFQIPLMLHKLVPSHKLFFRTYGEDWFETIVYAVPDHRIAN